MRRAVRQPSHQGFSKQSSSTACSQLARMVPMCCAQTHLSSRVGEGMWTHGLPQQSQWGVPYSIMLWQIFQGNEQAMLQAERKGDIYESEGMFHHRKVSAGRTKTSSDDLELSGGAVKLKVDEFSEMSKWLGTREWSKFGNSMLTAAEEEKDGLRTKGQLCLQDVQTPGSFNPGGLSSSARPTKTVKLPWDKVLPTVSEAQAANDRLHRDCSRMVMKVRGGDPDLVTKIKETMAELTSNMGKLGDCQMWEEVPGSEGNEKSKVESFFAAIAQSTERANENLEQLKALCEARGLWTTVVCRAEVLSSGK